MRKEETNKRSHNFKDLTNQKFNFLTVIQLDKIKNGVTYWLCKCDCGKIRSVSRSHLKSGHTKSCGCKRDCKSIRNPAYKHGKRKTRLYQIWSNMKTRCYNSNNKRYKNYGARGIIICDEWLDKENGFMNFYNWAIKNGYQENLTIDRIDVNGNYKPNNCRWVNMKKQQNNRTNNMLIKYKNEIHTLQEWSEKLPNNISSSLLRYRILNGWDLDRAFNTIPRRVKK